MLGESVGCREKGRMAGIHRNHSIKRKSSIHRALSRQRNRIVEGAFYEGSWNFQLRMRRISLHDRKKRIRTKPRCRPRDVSVRAVSVERVLGVSRAEAYMGQSKNAAPPHEAVWVLSRQMDQRFPRRRNEGTEIYQCGEQLPRGCRRSRDRKATHAVTYGYNLFALLARSATYGSSVSPKSDSIEGCTVVSVPREIDGNRPVTSAFEDRHHAFPAPCPVPGSMDEQVS